MKRIAEVEVCVGKWNDVMEGVFIHKIVAYYHVSSETCLPYLAIGDVCGILWASFDHLHQGLIN